MLKLIGKAVTFHEFESKKTGQKYIRVGIVGEGEFNQVNGQADRLDHLGQGDDVELKVAVTSNGQIWLLRGE